MSAVNRNRDLEQTSNRRRVLVLLAVALLFVFGAILSQTSFDLRFLTPDSNQQLLFFATLSAVVFLLFVFLFFILVRNLLKVFAERRVGVLGSKFRFRLVVFSLLLSILPVMVMFWFAYGLMNRSIDKWFSSPVEEVRADTAQMTSMLSEYAAQNARAEAQAIADSPDTQRAFGGHGFTSALVEFRRREATLQGGFVFAIQKGNAEASFGAPAPWPVLKPVLPLQAASKHLSANFSWGGTEYVLASAQVSGQGTILVAMPLPRKFSETVKQIEASQARYWELSRQRRLVRRTYMSLLMLLTVVVLFATTWLALFFSKLVTRPVTALAEATQEISRGRFDYRVDVGGADEIGDLVRSFNRMAEELGSSRRQLNNSSHELAQANAALDQRRRHIETILESIPTGVLSLDANRRVSHVNGAFLRLFYPQGADNGARTAVVGADLGNIFPPELLDDFTHLFRRADRMSISASQLEIAVDRSKLNVAVTVATLEHGRERQGYVLVFEDLSDVLRAQRQAAWSEVARRVAHEIKNPLTPIALSAERIRKHVERGTPPDASSLEVIHSCAETIANAVETVRALVNEFSTLARFPAARPEAANINTIVENALGMFNGRLDDIKMHTLLAPDLPKVMADAEAIKRAVANLVDNAAEAVEDAMVREIQISTTLLGGRDMVEIMVADSGHGVTPELKEKLFLPYFSTKKRGTGLGLAIVSRIIEDHHGSIRVEENQPVGAKFIVELPVAPESISNPAPASHA
ncbi:MAG: HAMP domain-containing protein [Acidobacteria bacterium]|nr:HAMP domain-containing protein [Acidobacteriota bacterium]